MPYFTITSLANVQQAIELLSHAHGAYTAVDILKGALKDVDEPDSFAGEVQQARSEHGRSHEGPADADRAALKTLKTAANAEGPTQDALLELLSLAIVKLGVAKGSQILSLLLFACGFDPTLIVIVIKLSVLLAHTQTGKKIVAKTGPKLKQAISKSTAVMPITEPLGELANQLGEQGVELLAVLSQPKDLAQKAASAGLDTVNNLLRRSDDKSNK